MDDSRQSRATAGDGETVFGDGWSAAGDGLARSRWYAVVSSRLGRPVEKRRRWFQLLQRVVQQSLADDAALTVVEGTAAEPWVVRAAELYRAAMVRIRVDDHQERDRALIELADRVYALHVRCGGRVEGLLTERIRRDPASVRVAIWNEPRDAGAKLVAQGAVGWWLTNNPPGEDDGAARRAAALPISSRPGESLLGDGAWLIHCTRGRSGRWPWQSEQQWRDEVLLSGDEGRDLGPAEVLQRILHDRLLRGSAIVTSAGPVVCFSAVKIHKLLARRTFRSHLGRWDYEPYGIAIRRSVIEGIGGLPVVYANSWAESGLSREERWRFQACGKTFDWRSEQEWRVPGNVDLQAIVVDDAVVFVGDEQARRRLSSLSPWPVSVVGRESLSV